jgi:hypothetical protein
MVGITRPAAHFRRRAIEQRHNDVVGQPLALDAVVVEFVA